MSILTKIADDLLKEKVLDKKLHSSISKKLLKEYNIPLNVTNDLFSLRRKADTESEFVLYHIIKSIDKTKFPAGYPTEKIKKIFENTKYNNEKSNLPLEYDVIQIADDQWVGKIKARELFKLGNANMINYNENAQRVMKRLLLPSGEAFEIRLNKNAIDAIEASFNERRYVPNIITLNIPYTDESDFYYDKVEKKLIIKNISMFDILDGYHRYIAICRICSLDSKFDYDMELRITNYDDDKARQFIWQEDQKTKMAKVDSDSLNKYSTSNMIVKSIQSSIYGNYISYNKGIISSSVLSQSVQIIYNINPQRKYKISEINEISKEIVDGFNELQENMPDIFDAVLDVGKIFVIVYMIKHKIYDAKMFDQLYNQIKDNNSGVFKYSKALSTLDKYIKGGK